jgi:hypothetical protein
LWGWSIANKDQFLASRYHLTKGSVVCQFHRGRTVVAITQRHVLLSRPGSQYLPSMGGNTLFSNAPINNQNLYALTGPIRRKRGDFWYLVAHLDKHPLILSVGEQRSSDAPNATAERAFGQSRLRWLWFPTWYPALIFALAGVAALRLGRRFTLRSAIIGTAVVAGLLGMAVAL